MEKMKLIKKKRAYSIDNRYPFPCPTHMKHDLDKLKEPPYSLDVNEMLRSYAEALIKAAEKKSHAG